MWSNTVRPNVPFWVEARARTQVHRIHCEALVVYVTVGIIFCIRCCSSAGGVSNDMATDAGPGDALRQPPHRGIRHISQWLIEMIGADGPGTDADDAWHFWMEGQPTNEYIHRLGCESALETLGKLFEPALESRLDA